MRLLPNAITLYRNLLRQSMALQDDVLRYFFLVNVKHQFRQNIDLKCPKRARKELSQAYTFLRILVRANYGFRIDMQQIIGLAYGCYGPIYNMKLQVRHRNYVLELKM